MINGVQRSAKISAPRAMGQYWPYVLTTPVLRTRLWLLVQILDFTGAVRGGPMEAVAGYERVRTLLMEDQQLGDTNFSSRRIS